MMTLVDIVGSRGKAQILRFLFALDPREFHLRELTRQSRLALGTVQQELRRLVRTGLVTARKDGNRLYYQANRQNPVYSDLRNIVLKTDGLVQILQTALPSQEIRTAFVFGSIAADTARPDSDVDLMVIGSLGLRRVAHLLAGTAEQLGREINPHVLTVAEFVKRRRGNDHFTTSVLASPRLFVVGSEHDLAGLGG